MVFLVGFRVGLNVTDSNVIDVGYAGVIGANKILYGDKLIMNFDGSDFQYIVALDKKTGKTLWKTRLGDLLKNDSYGDGPRATPAIDGGRVYVLSGKGALQCLDASDGQVVWGCDLLEKFGGKPPEYGFAASPVVIGEMLVVVVGGGFGGMSAAARVSQLGRKVLLLEAGAVLCAEDWAKRGCMAETPIARSSAKR